MAVQLVCTTCRRDFSVVDFTIQEFVFESCQARVAYLRVFIFQCEITRKAVNHFPTSFVLLSGWLQKPVWLYLVQQG